MEKAPWNAICMEVIVDCRKKINFYLANDKTNKMKRIAILGPIPRDHIVTHQGDLIQKWGCVTHPVIALSTMVGNSIEIIPVSHFRQVDLDNVREVFRGYARDKLKASYLQKRPRRYYQSEIRGHE